MYKIKERKSKMNGAIMEKGGDKKQNKSESAEMCRLANAVVEYFLKYPIKNWFNYMIRGALITDTFYISQLMLKFQHICPSSPYCYLVVPHNTHRV